MRVVCIIGFEVDQYKEVYTTLEFCGSKTRRLAYKGFFWSVISLSGGLLVSLSLV